MANKEVFEKVVMICKDVFDNEDVVLTEATTAADVDEWDSLAHLSIINDIETEFEISFTLNEISNSRNLGELIKALEKHINEK